MPQTFRSVFVDCVTRAAPRLIPLHQILARAKAFGVVCLSPRREARDIAAELGFRVDGEYYRFDANAYVERFAAGDLAAFEAAEATFMPPGGMSQSRLGCVYQRLRTPLGATYAELAAELSATGTPQTPASVRRYHVPRLRGKYGVIVDSNVDSILNGGERERFRIRPPTRRAAAPLVELPTRATRTANDVGARLRRRPARTKLLCAFEALTRVGGCTTAELRELLAAEFGPVTAAVARTVIRKLRHVHQLETTRRLDPVRGWIFSVAP